MSPLSNRAGMEPWVKAAQMGDEAAWSVLYRQYYPGLYSIALRTCGDVPIAKDALQEAFVVAYPKLGQLKDAATFGGWLKKIVMHRCY